mmetsp:Transcript_3541/g.12714  ORF Transcript_3541/g.12714 Transcript_3541/m.12714 type:complete len:215 (+) Transcript_3541:5091-5735(+)
MYMMSVQPSSEMHWKMVSHAQRMVSKEEMLKLGFWPWVHQRPSGQVRPDAALEWYGYFHSLGPKHRSSSSGGTTHCAYSIEMRSTHDSAQVASPTLTSSNPQPAHSGKESAVGSRTSTTSLAHVLRIFSAKSWTPTIPKMKKAKLTSTSTSSSIGSDFKRVTTSTRIPSTPVMVRSGRSTRTVRIAVKLSTNGVNASSPRMTTKKSITFHPSLR